MSARTGRALALILLVAVVVVTADQLTKLWVTSSLVEGESVPVIGEALQWLYVKNPGAAFSFASGATWVFTLISSTVAVVILVVAPRVRSMFWAVFLGLILGGTVGNLVDRLVREPGFPVGHVIDFIYTPWMMPAIYNIADIAVVTGMGLFVIATFMGVGISGKRDRQDGADDEAQDASDAAAGRSGTE